MSFSASTCLTYTGTTTLGPSLNIYSNPISPSEPGTYVSNVPTVDITGGNCPYTFEVPDGTTIIRLLDNFSGCYCDIPISDNNLCTTCDLNFNYYEPVTVGNIVAGELTGSCMENITDYIINWYETGDTVNAVFTSGKGTDPLIGTYDYVHPLTGATSVLAPSGYYEAIIQKIKINGVIFSVTGGTGTVLADLDCLPSISNGNPILVEALTCSNGGASSDLPQYEHRFDYDAGTGGRIPIGLSTTFEFSANTNFFVWKFKGNTVPDKIKFTFIGSAYSEPILLEYWEVGGNIPYNIYNNNIYPKSASTADYFYKATCLTGLTINEGDNMLIEITPSTANTQTSWTFYCGCLDTFDCEICSPPSATTVSATTSYQLPIIESTITGVTGSCDTLTVSFRMSGYTNDCFTGSSLSKYTNLNYNSVIEPSGYNLNFNSGALYISNNYCTPNGGSNCGSFLCNNNGSTITYEKSPGLFKITSDSLSTISLYYSSYINCIYSQISPSYSGDNTNIAFYRMFYIFYPTSTGTTPCGDGTGYNQLYVHQSSSVTTGTTGGGDYYLEVTLPTITNGITYSPCDLYCEGNTDYFVGQVNYYSTETSLNYTGTTTVGSSYTNSFNGMKILLQLSNAATGYTLGANLDIYNFQNETYPSTGDTSYNIVPSYSGITCPNLTSNFRFYGISSQLYRKAQYYYTVELFDPLDFKNFRIYGYEINSSGTINSSIKTLVYEWSGGTNTYSNPEYLV